MVARQRLRAAAGAGCGGGVAGRQRLDLLLVERGLAPSRARAQALILAGQVRLDGVPAGKAGAQVAPDTALDVG